MDHLFQELIQQITHNRLANITNISQVQINLRISGLGLARGDGFVVLARSRERPRVECSPGW